MPDRDLQSQTIDFLRFPLIVGVVLIHSSLETTSEPGGGYDLTHALFSRILPSIAVPLFFFISGFLFFYKTPDFTVKTYGTKLRNRAQRLLIPYLFWNLVVLFLFFLAQTFIPNMLSGTKILIADYKWEDWVKVFTDPIAFQFWFIRDLIIVVIFTPVVYALVRIFRQYILFIGCVLWIFIDWWYHISAISAVSFLFFIFGAYFSIHKVSFVESATPFLRISALLTIIIVICQLLFRNETWDVYFEQIGVLVGIAFTISLSAHFIGSGKWRPNRFLSKSSFFIFAYHAMFLTLLIKIIIKVLNPQTNLSMIGIYFACPTLIILCGLGLYYLLKKYFPTFTEIITEGKW